MEPEKNPAFNFKAQFQLLMNHLSEEERKLVDKAMEPYPNERQQLKQIKKVLLSSEQTQIKVIFQRKFGSLFIGQYIYGSLQPKQSMLNALKHLEINSQMMDQSLTAKTFEEVKRVVELMELKNVHVLKEQLSKLTTLIYGKLVDQFLLSTQNIMKNEFRTKWLQTFVEIIRCINSTIRFVGKQYQQYQQYNTKILNSIRQCLGRVQFLTKEVLTQLYLALVYLRPEEQCPQLVVKKIHYFHACTIVKGENNLPQMLKLVSEIKETEHKSHLAPILMKSFEENFIKLAEVEKQNAFDTVILLFQVGRSVYNYLEQIINTIIANGGSWNLQGSFIRKFFIARIALKYLPSSQILKSWPTIIDDVIIQCGNMTVPYVVDCAEVLFAKLYEEQEKNYEKWLLKWVKSYKEALKSEDRVCVRSIVDFINPILLKINSKPYLLKELCGNVADHSTQLGVVSLLKCYKQIGKIKIENEKEEFQHIDDPTIAFSKTYIKNLLLNNDYMIALKGLQFLAISHHPSNPISPLEFELIYQFYGNSLKTSMPEYRKNYLTITKKLFDRIRNIYDREMTGRKRSKPILYYKEFEQFICKLIDLSFGQIYPDVIFQLANPALEIIHLIFLYFGTKNTQIKKGNILQASPFLKKTTFFDSCNFYNLVICLQSSYESVRSLAHELLGAYTELSRDDEANLKRIWIESVSNTNKLAIKSYEFACKMVSFISGQYPHLIPNLPSTYKLNQLNICELFLGILEERYKIFKQQFIDEGQKYYKNLLHGVFTIFSYLLENLAQNMKNSANFKQQYQPFVEEIKQFLNRFFLRIVDILNFSVQISSANVSTVVLDTLTQSQTDRKLKVDCRGHFLNQKNVGEYLQSTALISSMENEEEGIQNTLVVSFYLLTRQAGLVFQTIGSLVGNSHSKLYIPTEELIKLISTYFYALINLKHMGSVDRISNGLSKMSKVIFENQNKQLSSVPEKLLDKLLENLINGKFTNILRRSAGVPYAFSCLLKSEALKRRHLIDKTISTLLKLSQQSVETPIELRIHSLNILKKLFQDSDLKQDLDIFVSQAFITSIKGFTNEQWGVRNSSLMLFAVLANRTLGIQPTYNLLQFFHKCPDLLEFVKVELANHEASTMYPPLYPIVLLLSRLLPFDLKEKARMTIKGSTIAKQVRKQQLLGLLPLLRKAGNNHNYMGRVMGAKAILPFMEISKIIPYCLDALDRISEESKTIKNNELHYELTESYQLIVSFHQICKQQKYALPELSAQTIQRMFEFINKKHSLVLSLKSPTIQDILLKIFIQFVENYHQKLTEKDSSIFVPLGKVCSVLLQKIYEKWWILGDLGHSLMIKSALQLLFKCAVKYAKKPSWQFLQAMILNLNEKMKNDPNIFKKVDNEIVCEFLDKIHSILTHKRYDSENLKVLLQKWLGDVEITEIGNDDIIVQLLQILPLLPKISINHKKLLQFENKSQNKHMKLAIFDFLKHTNADLTELLYKYSDPNELEEIRYCCVEALEQAKKIDGKLLLVYARLLEDEEYEIRRNATKQLSRMLNLNSVHNEGVILKEIQKLMKGEDLLKMINENSDYLIRRKNSIQERIFSYDKPNKYRGDIDNIIEVALNLPPTEINESLKAMNLGISDREEEEVLEKYQRDILERNQYQFETIIRLLLRDLPVRRQKYEKMRLLHPAFAKVFSHMCK